MLAVHASCAWPRFYPRDVPSTSSPVVGPPRFKKRTPSPLLLLSSVVGDAIDGVDGDSEIPVAALSSVVFLSFLLFVVVVVVNLSEDDGGVAKSRVDVLTSCSHLLQSILICTLFEWDKGCRLTFGVQAVAILSSTIKSDTNAVRTLSL
jgi:hypothetical protein